VGTPVTIAKVRDSTSSAVQAARQIEDVEVVEVVEEMPPPNCQCDPPKLAFRKTARTPKNMGRDYWTCSEGYQSDSKCRFFAWADELEGGIQKMRAGPGQTNASPSKRPRFCAETGIVRAATDVISVQLHEIDTLSTTLNKRSFKPSILAEIRGLSGARSIKCAELDGERVLLPLAQLDAITNFATQNNLRFVLDLPPDVLEKLRTYHQKERDRRTAGNGVKMELEDILPPNMVETLMEYQVAGIHFALDRGGRCLIGDDMGLGKTLQAIAVAR
jgi:GRF zinc finger